MVFAAEELVSPLSLARSASMVPRTVVEWSPPPGRLEFMFGPELVRLDCSVPVASVRFEASLRFPRGAFMAGIGSLLCGRSVELVGESGGSVTLTPLGARGVRFRVVSGPTALVADVLVKPSDLLPAAVA